MRTKMRTKPTLLLLIGVTGWGTVPPAPGSRENTAGEEIIAGIAAALDSPAPQLSTIGIIDGTWDRIADPDLGAEIGKYAQESGTAVDCSWEWEDGRHACSGNPSLFLAFEPYGDTTPGEIGFMVSTPDFGTAFNLSAKVTPLETGGWEIEPPRFRGFVHFAFGPPGGAGSAGTVEELRQRNECRGVLEESAEGLERAADTDGIFWRDGTAGPYPGSGVVFATTDGDRETGRARISVNSFEQPLGGLPHSVTHSSLHATLNDTYFTESTRLPEMIRVESATWSATAGCYYLVRDPGR